MLRYIPQGGQRGRWPPIDLATYLRRNLKPAVRASGDDFAVYTSALYEALDAARSAEPGTVKRRLMIRKAKALLEILSEYDRF